MSINLLVIFSDLSLDRGGRCFSRNDVISSNRCSSSFKMASFAFWMRMSSVGCVAEDSTKHVSPPAYTCCTWCLGVGASTVETRVGVGSLVWVPKPSCPFAPRPHDNRREDDVTNKSVWRLKIEQSFAIKINGNIYDDFHACTCTLCRNFTFNIHVNA